MNKKGILSLKGANCASCAYTIEHVGRKIKGIEEIRVQAGEQRVYVDYSGDKDVLDKVASIVASIGYEAEIVETEAV